MREIKIVNEVYDLEIMRIDKAFRKYSADMLTIDEKIASLQASIYLLEVERTKIKRKLKELEEGIISNLK